MSALSTSKTGKHAKPTTSKAGKPKLVRYTRDANNPPKYTKRELERLAAMTDKDIDTSDIPPLTEGGWIRAADLEKDNKVAISLRIDADIVAFFKARGPRYQTRINAVLRAYVDAHT